MHYHNKFSNNSQKYVVRKMVLTKRFKMYESIFNRVYQNQGSVIIFIRLTGK